MGWSAAFRKIRNFGKMAFFFMLCLCKHAIATTYFSQGSVDPATTNNWNTLRAAGGSAPSSFSAGDIFVIQSGHSMNPATVWTVSGTNSEIQVEAGGTLNISTSNVIAERLTVNS